MLQMSNQLSSAAAGGVAGTAPEAPPRCGSGMPGRPLQTHPSLDPAPPLRLVSRWKLDRAFFVQCPERFNSSMRRPWHFQWWRLG